MLPCADQCILCSHTCRLVVRLRGAMTCSLGGSIGRSSTIVSSRTARSTSTFATTDRCSGALRLSIAMGVCVCEYLLYTGIEPLTCFGPSIVSCRLHAQQYSGTLPVGVIVVAALHRRAGVAHACFFARNEEGTTAWWVTGKRSAFFFCCLCRNSFTKAIEIAKVAGYLQARMLATVSAYDS